MSFLQKMNSVVFGIMMPCSLEGGLEVLYSFKVLIISYQTTAQYCDREYYIVNLHYHEDHVYFEIFKAILINIHF
jgi:hypothetical protein